MPASGLSGLFRYAKASNWEALENFCTEALATAVRHEPGPLLSVLRDAGVVEAAHGAPVRVLTQVVVPAVGTIDLVLVFQALEVWIEVKVNASESANQLDKYQAYVAGAPCETRLATLAKEPLRVDITPLRWQQLRRAIGGTRTGSPYWGGLRTYLEEIRMADAFDEPISDAEQGALAPAHALLHKVARMLVPVAESAASLTPNLVWRRGDKAVLKELTEKLRDYGVMSISTRLPRGRPRAGISVGAFADEQGLGIGTWVLTDSRAVAARRKLLRQADQGKLPAHWERSLSGWEALGRYAPLREFRDHEAASTWLRASLRELDAAGLPALIPTLGLKTAEEEDEGEEDPGAGA